MDISFTIAIGRSRKEMYWKNDVMTWHQFLEKIKDTWRTSETQAEYKMLPKAEQDVIKDVGGFVGGALKDGRRKSSTVMSRQLLTLDADYITGDLWAMVESRFGFACCIYSTHKHSPESPRLRLVAPLKRQVTPDEYKAIARRIAADIGIDFFDDTTYEPHRLMYWPSTSSDGEYVFKQKDGPWLDPDDVLARYLDWTDVSSWPELSRTSTERKRLAEKQGDPLTKDGLVGVFCRTYTIAEAIDTFLQDVYTPCEAQGRYTYIRGSTTGGLVEYDNGRFVYSHHGTDPISGKLCNAFDLVRLHKFGAKDDDADPGTPTIKLPSYTAMLDFARMDSKVLITLGEDRLDKSKSDFGEAGSDASAEWMTKLEVDRRGKYTASIDNVKLILENDPRLYGKLAYNEFSNRPVTIENLPWRKVRDTESGDAWEDVDDAALRHYIEVAYTITAPSKINDALAIVQMERKFHPVREYLDSLEWDGTPRLETMLIDYLGAADTPYVRAVTRKAFTAAVARVYVPGVKYDYMLVLVGPQGIGKSLLIDRMGVKWYSDSLTTVQGKEGYEQLQGAWLIEMAELTATKKTEVEAVKHFISKREDSYRVAYGKRVTNFPRQCVFFGTTNDQEFLRDRTGNRRFWPADVGLRKPGKTIWTDLTPDIIGQLWAEAKASWHADEVLYLDESLIAEAIKEQEVHSEQNAKAGLIQEFLERLYPEDWDDRDLAGRRLWLNGEFGGVEGTIRREKVCAIEIWMELFNGDIKQLTQGGTAREIHDMLRQMPGWEPYKNASGKMRFGKLYGIQRAYVRIDKNGMA